MKKLLLFLAILFPSVLFAQGSQYQSILLGPTGRPAAGAVITVCAFGSTGVPCQSPINLFSDPALSVPMTNPTKSDSLGNWGFWALPNNYVYTVTGVGITANGPFVISVPCNLNSSCSGTTSTFAGLPVSPVTNALAIVTDGNGNNCLGGGGTVRELCQWTGTAWVLISAPVTANFPITAAQGGTGNVTLPAHSVLLGEGTSPVAAATPNSNAQCLMTAPSNFATTDPSFQTCPSGGGGGSPSQGSQGIIQGAGAVAGTFQVSNLSEAANGLTIAEDVITQGPNLGVDIRKFGARAVSTSAIPLTTGTITAGTSALVVASNSGWQKNDGIALVGAGATNCGTPPSAPTVTPSLASSMTGTGHAVAGATGSTSYSYVVVAVSQGGCYTAASAIGSTATGNANLGATNIPITSCANASGTVTCTVGSTTGLATGMWVRIGGTLDDGEFGGRHNITVINGTQFTYASNVSSIYPMFSTTTTGGTLYFWRENHIVLPTLPAGTNLYKYAVYRCTGASCALPANAANYLPVYISYPANLSFIDPAYNTWDDYGSISTVNMPWFIPTTPPATKVNDMLVTTITGIAGTAFTLAANATNSVSASPIRFDNAPAITACEVASNTAATGGGGACHIPPPPQVGGAGAFYVTSSYLVLNSIMNVGGPIDAGETIELSGNQGALFGTFEDTIDSRIPGSGSQTLLPMTCRGANPCIWRKGPPIRNLNIVALGPSQTLVFDNSLTPTLTENVLFNVPDGMGIAYLAYNARFGGTYINTAWTAGPTQVIGAIDTPVYRNINSTQTRFDNVSGSLRGLYFECTANAPPNGADDCAFYISVRQGENTWQGPITPLVTVNAFTAGRYGWIYLEHMLQDSGAEPIFVASGAVLATLIINGTDQPGGDPGTPLGDSQPLISGNPIFGGVSLLTDSPMAIQSPGINHDLFQCPQAATTAPNYRGCALPSLNLATTSYSGNHTLNASEGIVFETGSGTTITANSALAGQVWDVFNTSSGTVTLAISSGTLSCTGAVGSCTIPANQGAHVACNGTNCSALGLGGGGGGGSPGGTTDALQYNGGGSSFGGVNSPTVNGSYLVGYRVTAGAVVPPTIALPGIAVNPQTGTTYTEGSANTDSDRGYLVTASNAGAQTYTMGNPSVAGFGSNYFNVLRNIGAGTVTENASGFTVNGGASLLVPSAWTRFLWSDGVNYLASRFPDYTAFPASCTTALTVVAGVFSCGGAGTVSGVTGDAGLFCNVGSTGSVTLTPCATTLAHKFWGNNTGSTGTASFVSIGKADLPAVTVFTDQTNTYGAFLQDFSAGTWKFPTGAGATASATNTCVLDTTNKNIHCYINNADAIVGGFASAPTTGDCVKAIVASGNVLLADGGGLNCGIQNTTTTNPTTAVAGNTCGSATTLTMTGVTSTMIPLFGAPSDITASTGWGSTGGLVIVAWFTTNTLNYKICNQSASSITPGAVAWNVGAR